jgi:hypothetical protein
MGSRRSLVAALAAAFVAAAFAGSASPALRDDPTCAGGYTYAGLWSERLANSITATITPLDAPNVQNGHVAAWVNVGGPAAWLQVGVNSTPGTTDSHLYYELMAPGASDTTYVPLKQNVQVGEPHRVSLLEVPGRPSYWRVVVDGVQQGSDILLTGSHARWHVSVSAESFQTGDGPCNHYRYALAHVRTTVDRGPASARPPLVPVADPGYHLITTAADATFEASGHD